MIDEVLGLDSSDIRTLHDEQIKQFGGIYGENNPSLIEYMADKPFLELFGEEKYPTIFKKAAVYLEGFVKNQYFSDGNKRTGVKCALVFLAINGYRINVTDSELHKFTLLVAESSDPTSKIDEISLNEIANWFRKNSEKELLIT